MLNYYLPDDICNIIQQKLSLDYKKYKFWCFDECKWVYIWTCNFIKCPNNDKHNVDCIQIIDCIQSNYKILFLDKSKIVDDITQTEFKIINLIT